MTVDNIEAAVTLKLSSFGVEVFREAFIDLRSHLKHYMELEGD